MAIPSGYFVAMAGENAHQLREDADASLRPFIGYMNRAIDVLEKKRIKCCWEPINRGGWILSPKTQIYEILPQTKIRIKEPESGWVDLFIDEEDESSLDEYGLIEDDFTIRWGKGSKRGELTLNKESVRKTESGTWQMRFFGDVIPGDNSITWQEYRFTWKRCISPFEAKKLLFSAKGNEIQAKASGEDNQIFTLDALLKGDDKLNVNGVETEFQIINRFDLEDFLKEYSEFPSQHGGWLVSRKNKPHLPFCKCLDITNELMKNLRIPDILLNGVQLDKEKWEYDGSNHMLSSANETVQSPKGTFSYGPYPEWQFVHTESQSKDKWIQLIEDEDNSEGDVIEKSELEYFFDENVSIYRTEKRVADEKYHILKSKPDEYQILLSPKKGERAAFPESNYLYLKADTSELKNQRSALRALESRPFPENLPLLELMQNRDSKRWEIFRPLSTPKYDWKVLTDSTYDGSDKQQQFVCTALATPDFAILDGPPGTGKTTTIRELILQLILDGKRVLLAASTNAAINNVLERLRDEDKGKAPVYATRLGREDRAINVEEYVFDTQVRKWIKNYGLNEDEARHLIIESANLVCGTTSGIHRLFNWSNKNEESDPFGNLTSHGAPFDVMIIDECSKTTFQEFLVPARLAKKWILVGDVRQLSPFTDRGQITSNLENIEGMTPALQKACALLQQLSPFHDKLIVPVDDAVMVMLQKEYQARVSGENPDRDLENRVMLIHSDEIFKLRPDLLYQCNMLFITEALFKKYDDWMPKDAIVLKDDWMETPHAFTHFSSKKWSHKHSYFHKGNRISEGDKVHALLIRNVNKPWSDELCWRLEREYWLRYLESGANSNKYKSQINRLMPASRDVNGLVYSIRNIAFPSILESLSTTGMNLKRNITPTTLTRGFTNNELACRLVTLTHQHRMDPAISEPPRELFYSEGSGKGRHARSLLDGGKVADRKWTYDVYPSRRVWIDCNGRVGDKNSNSKEAERIIRELKKFCEWAGDHPYEVAILTFYKGQEGLLREKLKELPDQKTKFSRFSYRNCSIRLATVDFFQGQEADIVFLSMVNTFRDGFLDTPNRLNVAITRARHQMVIVGKHSYFKNDSRTRELNKLAKMYVRID